MSIKQLRQRLHDLRVEGQTILRTAKAEGRELTEEEESRLQALETQVNDAQAAVEAEESRMERERTFGVLEVDEGARITGGGPAAHEFESFGHQLKAIVEAGRPGGRIDPRLLEPEPGMQAAASGGSSGVGSDGGFLVRTEYSSEIYRRAYETGALASRCMRIGIGEDADSLTVPYIDETSRATGSRWGGVQVYRRNEADTVTASRPKIGEMETRLEDLMGIAYATDRSLRDARAMSQVYMMAFSEEFAFKLDDEIFRGVGAGECLGVKNSSATISVAKETGQLADTVVFENIVNMWARCWGRSRPNAVWFINQDVEPQLFSMGVTVGTGGVPAYLPPGGLSDSPYARLFGRPVIPIEHADTLGDAGDISLLDLSQYQLIDKDGLQDAVSMHVRFIYAEQTFRWIMRVNGQPKWRTALTPYKGSNTLSPFVQLAARA